ncbi:hypothetical protein B0H14DRAFT_2588262 [Mycena olivaceomarginata]|nr:hypothetical protein B0H14DRAFT_2588262 [Mycena olivaceomarginata]
MEACLVVSGILLSVAYGTAHCIVANIIGHGILAIAHPSTYIPTLSSAAFTPLYGTPIFTAGVFVFSVIGVAICARSTENMGKMILWMEILLPIPAGVIANVIGRQCRGNWAGGTNKNTLLEVPGMIDVNARTRSAQIRKRMGE